jgi:glutaredoxin 3
MSKKITMYATKVCPYCVSAIALLKKKGVNIDDINKIMIDGDMDKKEAMIAKTGKRTVPQIFIGEFHVGGCDDLHALDKEGKLDKLLGLGK